MTLGRQLDPERLGGHPDRRYVREATITTRLHRGRRRLVRDLAPPTRSVRGLRQGRSTGARPHERDGDQCDRAVHGALFPL